ncbi:MAG: hypothetical protein WAV52_14675 [Luteococcus japonicus]
MGYLVGRLVIHRWCWGLAGAVLLLAIRMPGAGWLGWLTMVLLLVGDVLWVQAARRVAEPRRMPTAGYILMALLGIPFLLAATVGLLFLAGAEMDGDAAWSVPQALLVALDHLPAWLAASLLGESPRPRLMRIVSLVGMVLVVPALFLAAMWCAPGAASELLLPLPVLAWLAVLGSMDLLSRRAASRRGITQ